MIDLPKTLEVDGVEYPIDSDFRTAYKINIDFADKWGCDDEQLGKVYSCLYNLYGERIDGKWVAKIPENTEEALRKAIWFLDGGDNYKLKKNNIKVIDFEQDANLIFPAINVLIKTEVRELPYLHWWTFLGYLQNAPQDTMFSTVMNLRQKKAKGKMDKYDRQMYNEYKGIIEIKQKLSEEEQRELEEEERLVRQYLGG